MAIDSISSLLPGTYSDSSSDPVTSVTASQSAETETDSLSVTDMKKQLNISIMQEAVTVSTSIQDQSLAMTFRAIVERLNKALEPELGPNAIENTAATQDTSPEATAASIVSFATSFLSAYQSNHEGENENDVLNNYMELIRKGIDDGFGSARKILKDLDVLKDDIASNIDKTYALVQKGLEDFLAAQKKDSESDTDSDDVTDSSSVVSSAP